LWLTCLIICGLLAWVILAYWPGCLLVTAGFLPLIGLAYCGLATCLIICGLLAWLILAYWPGCLLVTAGFLPLIGLAYCGLQWLQWLQLGVTFSQVVWLIGC